LTLWESYENLQRPRKDVMQSEFVIRKQEAMGFLWKHHGRIINMSNIRTQ